VKTALVYDSSRQLVNNDASWIPSLSALIYLAHPMNVSAVGKIDTLSEDLAATFALAVVNLALRSVRGPQAPPDPGLQPRVFLAAGAVLLGMLSKEGFAGMAVATPVLFVVATGTRDSSGRRALLILLTTLAMAAAAYFALRLASGFPLTGALEKTDRYQLHLGFNVLKNVVAEICSILFPGNTLKIFVGFDAVHIAISSALLLTVSALAYQRLHALATVLRNGARERRMAAILGVALLASFFPSCMITELVSENATAEALPIIVISVTGIFAFGSQRQFVNWPVIPVVSVFAVLWLAAATGDKAAAARDVSVRAYEIGDRIAAAYNEKPKARVTVCFAPGSLSAHPRKYSVLSMPDDFAAYFQLYRVRMAQPAPLVTAVNLSGDSSKEHPPCDISVVGFTVSGP